MPRRITVYVASPPGDGGSVRAGREMFHEYVRPVLMAGGMDWDVVEGRREGDVREVLAGRVRQYRRRKGGERSGVEYSGVGNERLKEEVAGEQKQKQKQDQDLEEELRLMREKAGIKEWEGVAGDIVLGRHTWKEYVRGLHEGWLGPLEAPRRSNGDDETTFTTTNTTTTASLTNDDASPTSTTSLPSSAIEPSTSTESTASSSATNPNTPPSSQPEKSKSRQPPSSPYIHPFDYPKAPLPINIPTDLGPSTTLPFPHILGFLNTPIRLKRFLMRRKLADEIGREVAGVVLGRSGEFERTTGTAATMVTSSSPSIPSTGRNNDDDASPVSTTSSQATPDLDMNPERERRLARDNATDWQQAYLLEHEEADWPSTFRRSRRKEQEQEEEQELKKSDGEVKSNKSNNDDGGGEGRKESVWVDDVVLDDRIAGRMRRFVSES